MHVGHLLAFRPFVRFFAPVWNVRSLRGRLSLRQLGDKKIPNLECMSMNDYAASLYRWCP